jgi:tRNA pseudouridine55 synthase
MSYVPEEGKVILIHKELGWTSFDVVKKIRNLLRIKKVGHAGTLDPLATGLLIVCAGKMTKQINLFMDQEKEYTGTMQIGKTTPSVDLETAYDSEQEINHITEENIFGLTEKFTGNLMQKPPIFSAIKKDGIPLYLKARKGENVKIEPRPVEAKTFEVTDIRFPEIKFRLVCSKGFYVRSLVRDFGEALGVGACLTALERTRIGDFKLSDAQTVAAFKQSLQEIDS